MLYEVITYRGDQIDVQLWHSPNRIRMNNFTSDIVDEQNLNVWFQQEFVFSPLLSVITSYSIHYTKLYDIHKFLCSSS